MRLSPGGRVWNYGPERDDLCEVLNDRAAAIRAMPVDDLDGLAVKARAVAWVCNLDQRGEDDYLVNERSGA